MPFTGETRLGDLVAEQPQAAGVLDALGIDYCCGGERSLTQACEGAGVALHEVLARLAGLAGLPRGDLEQPKPRDFRRESLVVLMDHLVSQHHTFTREELTRAAPLLEKVQRVHGERHPELAAIRDVFVMMHDELLQHLLKEERILFPYVAALEAAAEHGSRPSAPPFGSVENPVRAMRQEHDVVGGALRTLRTASGGFVAPADGCGSYRALYGALEGLEQDLHRHIHLENNILFPRALALETQVFG